MNISAEDFRQHFALLSDEALLATRRDDLTDVAKACYDDEVAGRKLSPAAEEDTQEAEIQEERSEEDQAKEHGGDMVSLTSFPDVEEARLARGLLQIAGIPSFLANENAGLGGALHLMVPAEFAEVAMQILEGGDISDEELAAQAEAAVFEETEEEDEFEEAEEPER